MELLDHVSFPGGSDGKEFACNTGDLSSIPGSGRFPCRMKWQPTLVFLPRKFHGQRRPVCYSSWGHKQLDTTEHAHHPSSHTTRQGLCLRTYVPCLRHYHYRAYPLLLKCLYPQLVGGHHCIVFGTFPGH